MAIPPQFLKGKKGKDDSDEEDDKPNPFAKKNPFAKGKKKKKDDKGDKKEFLKNQLKKGGFERGK